MSATRDGPNLEYKGVLIRGGQNPPDPTNPSRLAPIWADFKPFFAGSDWELQNPVGSVRVSDLSKIFGWVPAPPRMYPYADIPSKKQTLDLLTFRAAHITLISSRTHSLPQSSPTTHTLSLTASPTLPIPSVPHPLPIAHRRVSNSISRSLAHIFPHFQAPAPHAQLHH